MQVIYTLTSADLQVVAQGILGRVPSDGGYAVGAILAGLLADAFNTPIAIAVIGGLTFLSGVVVASVMY